MADGDHNPGDLKKVVVRICPACGVVNPSGPSAGCAHLQLARFNGVGPDLASLLDDVASARSRFDKLVSALKSHVKEALRAQKADIETAVSPRGQEVDRSGRRERIKPLAALSLKSPELAPVEKREKKRASRGRGPRPVPVDPRQLELIAREPPKGDA